MAESKERTSSKEAKHLKNDGRRSWRGGNRAGRAGIIRVRIFVTAVVLLILLILVFKLVSYVGGISRVHLRDEGYTHARRFENCIRLMGIDVSAYQGEISWRKVKSSEADFAFIRAGYRKSDSGELFEDDFFRKNIKAANKAGVMCGAYFFSQALNEEEAEEEADYLIDLVKKYDIDMPLVIDYETIPDGRLQKAIANGDFYAASQFHDIVLAFCRRVEDAGYESAVYANYSMLTDNMDASLLQKDASIWVAQYGGRCDLKTAYSFWQCSETANIGGIKGQVDQDFWYVEPGKVYETRAKSKKKAVSIGDCEISFDSESYKLHNHLAKPKLTVTYNGKKLREGKDYELSAVRNQKSGTGYAVIRGIKKYKDRKAVAFTVE